MAEEKWDDLFPGADKQRAENEEKGLVFAQRYLVFKHDPRAQQLLEHWTAMVRNQAIAPNATVQEYAYFNSRREFIESIHAQILFASNGGNQPPVRK